MRGVNAEANFVLAITKLAVPRSSSRSGAPEPGAHDLSRFQPQGTLRTQVLLGRSFVLLHLGGRQHVSPSAARALMDEGFRAAYERAIEDGRKCRSVALHVL